MQELTKKDEAAKHVARVTGPVGGRDSRLQEELTEGLRETLAERDLEGLRRVPCKGIYGEGHVWLPMPLVSDSGDFLGNCVSRVSCSLPAPAVVACLACTRSTRGNTENESQPEGGGSNGQTLPSLLPGDGDSEAIS